MNNRCKKGNRCPRLHPPREPVVTRLGSSAAAAAPEPSADSNATCSTPKSTVPFTDAQKSSAPTTSASAKGKSKASRSVTSAAVEKTPVVEVTMKNVGEQSIAEDDYANSLSDVFFAMCESRGLDACVVRLPRSMRGECSSGTSKRNVGIPGLICSYISDRNTQKKPNVNTSNPHKHVVVVDTAVPAAYSIPPDACHVDIVGVPQSSVNIPSSSQFMSPLATTSHDRSPDRSCPQGDVAESEDPFYGSWVSRLWKTRKIVYSPDRNL